MITVAQLIEYRISHEYGAAASVEPAYLTDLVSLR
jgi:hypothetical protein